MTLYINPFVLGILATVGVEIILLIGVMIYQADKKKK